MNFFGNSWDNVLEDEFNKPYFKQLLQKVDEEYAKGKCYPPQNKIFSCLKLCDYNDVKVVLLGQDPYHGEGQAHGLCFSVMPNVTPPPSLKNIFKELKSDLNIDPPNHGCLVSWAKQGVLLLNTVMTVRQGSPNSHATLGWQTFTDAIIEKINKLDKPVVFLLWGANAKSKEPLIDFGCKHFSKTNEFLIKHNRTPINWQIPNI